MPYLGPFQHAAPAQFLVTGGQIVMRYGGVEMMLDMIIHLMGNSNHLSHAGPRLVRAASKGEC